MECSEVAERLTDLMEGDLSEEEEAAALAHLASCPSCEAVLAETRDVERLARDHGRVELTAEDRERMLSSVVNAVKDSPDR